MSDTLHNTPSGVRRTTATTQRERIVELTTALADAERKLEKAQNDVQTLAQFIQRRIDVNVWEHTDVMTILNDTVVNVCAGVLAAVQKAEVSGVPASYRMFHELVVSRFDQARVNLLHRVGHPGETGHINSPHCVTDRMKEDLSNVVKLPEAA